MTVIVGVDNSEASKAALRLAAQEARWRQASLVAVSAYELPISPLGGFPRLAGHTLAPTPATVHTIRTRDALPVPCGATFGHGWSTATAGR